MFRRLNIVVYFISLSVCNNKIYTKSVMVFFIFIFTSAYTVQATKNKREHTKMRDGLFLFFFFFHITQAHAIGGSS